MYPPETFASRRAGCSPEQVAHDVGTKPPGVGGRRTDLGSLVSLLSLTNDGPETSRRSIAQGLESFESTGEVGPVWAQAIDFLGHRSTQRLEQSSPRTNTGEPMGTPSRQGRKRLGERSIPSASGMFRIPALCQHGDFVPMQCGVGLSPPQACIVVLAPGTGERLGPTGEGNGCNRDLAV